MRNSGFDAKEWRVEEGRVYCFSWIQICISLNIKQMYAFP